MEKFRESVEVFDSEFADFEQKHFEYVNLCEEIRSKQQSCLHDIKHYRLYIQMLTKEMQNLKDTTNMHEAVELSVIKERFEAKKLILSEMEQSLPKKNGPYLSVVLGAVDVSFTSKQEKFAYKNNYENFKIVVSGIMALFALLLYICPPVRAMDSLFHFLLVWYYCTLTIREQILIQNGSKIKGWWATYHFILTVLAGVMLIWPHSQSYLNFRDQFMLYSFYISIVQCIQYYYQIGCLYKLRALGERHSMDITVDGYMSWMSSRLSFLLIFLMGAYAFQIYNAYSLYLIYLQKSCKEWHPLAVGLIYGLVASGNLLTTVHVIRQKCTRLSPVKRKHLSKKYSTKYVHASDLLCDRSDDIVSRKTD